MRRKLRTAVMQEFCKLMQEKIPEFSLVHKDRTNQELIFENPVRGDLSFFIRIFASHRREEFDIDLAWSELSSWASAPEFPRHIVALMRPDDRPDAGAMCFALHWLKPNPAPGAVGWDFNPGPDIDADVEEWLKPPPTVEELLPKVPVLVREAVEALLQLGMPYFERILGERTSGREV